MPSPSTRPSGVTVLWDAERQQFKLTVQGKLALTLVSFFTLLGAGAVCVLKHFW